MSDSPDLFISAIAVPPDHDFALAASGDHYEVHRALWGAGAFADPRAARILFRIEHEPGQITVYVQTHGAPDWARLRDRLRLDVAGPVPLRWPPMEPGARLRFRLLTRPSIFVGKTQKMSGLFKLRGVQEQLPRLQAHGSLKRKRLALWNEEDQRDWLARKAAAHGFALETCHLSGRTWIDTKHGAKVRGMAKPLSATLFDGLLTVTDPARLREAVRGGVGPQKAYGFGLLSLAKAE